MPAPTDKPRNAAARKADKELLFKAVTCSLIGLVILLAPYVARSDSVRELMAQATLVGWFALVLGIGFGVLYGVRRAQAGRHQP
ncbi:hypothetical protein [Acidovorax kalamii]|uniref:Uncharacterized protein n=1 Tax=Acidovorax kalamii TaxID=2004485 RepID=A0A235EQF3_9BURK|nr:hypothetical protein [Acidovorax kalamii]OYD51286.1 hypothetical protein CBY09_05520 [Acidovorax kalamii]